MKKIITRQEFLRNSAKCAAGITAGVAGLGLLSKTNASPLSGPVPLPWPYMALDVEEARKLGHLGYWSGLGCSYGAFEAIIHLLKDEVGDPYTSMPTEFLEWGRGGGWGWGTLCGALTGALTALNLCFPKPAVSKLGNELLGWYTQTEFPTDISNQYAQDEEFYDNRYTEYILQTVSDSPLCHISVSRWIAVTGEKLSSVVRGERCARLTGDVAAYTVQIMNDELNNNFTPIYTPPDSVVYCMSCHGAGGMDDTIGKMECTKCHGDHTAVSAGKGNEFAPTYKLNQNFPNPFNPKTTIQFSIPQSAPVYLAVYDIHGRLVKNLVDLKDYNSGMHTIVWDGTNNYGQRVASGTYFYRLQAGEYTESKRMLLVK